MASTPDLDRRPRRHPSTAFKAIGDEGGLVVIPERSEVKVLNPVGVRIYALLDGTLTVGEIVRTICDEYEVTHEAALADVTTFLADLDRQGMLAHAEATPTEAAS